MNLVSRSTKLRGINTSLGQLKKTKTPRSRGIFLYRLIALQHTKPEIIVIDKENNIALIIDVAVPNHYNICRKRLDKIRTYTDLAVEIKTLWALSNVHIVPVIVGATGAIYNGFDQDIEKLHLKRVKFDKYQAQKIALLGTAHIVRSFSQIA